VNRLLAGRSAFIGGKDHTTHHLFFRGLTEKKIATLFFLIGGAANYIAWRIIATFSWPWFWTGLLFVAGVFVSLYLCTVSGNAARKKDS
jgi:UDP-GlcNAc:undecaprenyl-phosphate GlcNAc-1-phosphate transferase